MSQQFTPKQESLLKDEYVSQNEGSVPLFYLDLTDLNSSDLVAGLDLRYIKLSDSGSYATAGQGTLADSALQPGEAATTAQGALANSALQPGDNLTNPINGVAAATLTSQAANGQTAFGWGDHSTQGYLTTAPLKLDQFTAAGGAPESLTLTATPVAGSEAIVFVEAVPHHFENSDPPAAGNFYRSGTTVKVATTASDRVSVYYTTN